MKNIIKNFTFALCLVLAFVPILGLAANPYLNVSINGDNLSLYLNNANPNSLVQLSYTRSGSNLPTTITNANWRTDYGGNFSTYLSASQYGIGYGSKIYVTVGGQQSNSYTYSGGYDGYNYNNNYNYNQYYNPYYYNYGYGSLSLSQTSVNLTLGQSMTVNANNYYGGYMYISSNSNPNAVSASVNGNSVYLYGQNSGSANLTVCSYNNYGCANLYVSVSGYNYYNGYNYNYGYNYGYSGQLSFSQNNINLMPGQSTTITIYQPNNYYYSYNNYYNNNFYVATNGNQNAFTANVSGNILYINALKPGSGLITVCQNGLNICGSVYISVNYGYYYNNWPGQNYYGPWAY